MSNTTEVIQEYERKRLFLVSKIELIKEFINKAINKKDEMTVKAEIDDLNGIKSQF